MTAFAFDVYLFNNGHLQYYSCSRTLAKYYINIKDKPMHDRCHVALIAQLGEYCTSIAEVMGFESRSKPEMFFQVFVSVMLWLHSHLISIWDHSALHSFKNSSNVGLFSCACTWLEWKHFLFAGFCIFCTVPVSGLLGSQPGQKSTSTKKTDVSLGKF